MVALLCRWAEIGSGSGDLPGLSRMAGEISAALRALGARVEAVAPPGAAPGLPALGGTLLALKRPEAPLRVLLGIHMDTVFGPDHPFRRVERLDGATLRGPGVADAKGGLVVLLTALEAFERSPWAEALGWEVIVNSDEEIGSPGSRPFFAQAARRCRVGLLFEPAFVDGALVSARKGSGNFTATVQGRTAHAGRNPEEGRNAIVALSALILRLVELHRPGIFVNPGEIEGGTASNVVPDLARCRFNVRVERPEEQAEAEAFVAAAAAELSRDGISVDIRGEFSRPPKPLEPSTELLLSQLAGCAADLGFELTWRPSGGASDGNLLAAAGLPTVDSLGPRGAELHSEREFIVLESLAERAKLTALFLMKLAAGRVAPAGGEERRT
ncbi:MAG: hydrolase [Deltaproteobacteria bacterium]|nr:hydrolase [Deltaproteobacteria bacterium]